MLNTRIGRLTTLLVLISLTLVSSFFIAPRSWTATAQEPDITYEEVLASAKDLLHRYRYDEAVKAFRHANEMRDKKSAECFAWMSDAYRPRGLQERNRCSRQNNPIRQRRRKASVEGL